MKKSIKERRLEIYKKMLAILEHEYKNKDYWGSGFCWALLTVDWTTSIRELPELLAYKPKDLTTLYWFPCTYSGVKKRIGILKAIIAKMESHD